MGDVQQLERGRTVYSGDTGSYGGGAAAGFIGEKPGFIGEKPGFIGEKLGLQQFRGSLGALLTAVSGG